MTEIQKIFPFVFGTESIDQTQTDDLSTPSLEEHLLKPAAESRIAVKAFPLNSRPDPKPAQDSPVSRRHP